MLVGDDVRVLVATRPIDFRAGINRLVSLISQSLEGDPYDGRLYVFRSKRNDRLKAIRFDGSGILLATKWLEAGKFFWPPIQDGSMLFERAAICRFAVRPQLDETGDTDCPQAAYFWLKPVHA